MGTPLAMWCTHCSSEGLRNGRVCGRKPRRLRLCKQSQGGGTSEGCEVMSTTTPTLLASLQSCSEPMRQPSPRVGARGQSMRQRSRNPAGSWARRALVRPAQPQGLPGPHALPHPPALQAGSRPGVCGGSISHDGENALAGIVRLRPTSVEDHPPPASPRARLQGQETFQHHPHACLLQRLPHGSCRWGGRGTQGGVVWRNKCAWQSIPSRLPCVQEGPGHVAQAPRAWHAWALFMFPLACPPQLQTRKGSPCCRLPPVHAPPRQPEALLCKLLGPCVCKALPSLC